MGLHNPELTTPAESVYNPADFDAGDSDVYVPAPVQTSTVVAAPVANTGGLSYNPAAMAASGFEGIELDWTAYTRISLKVDGQFEDSDKKVIGKAFDCRMKSTKKQYVYRAVPNNPNDKTEILFSYTAPGNDRAEDSMLIEKRIGEWAAKGKGYEVKTYLEVLVKMVGGEYDGKDRILSVSPTSRGRCSKHAVEAFELTNGNPFQIVTEVSVGAKITTGPQPFFPWNFAIKE